MADTPMSGAFILGSARCGSTLVSDILRLHPGLLSLSEVLSTAGAHALPKGQIPARRFWRALSRPTRIGRMTGNPARAPREFLYGRQAGNRYDPFDCPPLLQVALPHLSDRPDDLFDALAGPALAQPVQPVEAHYQALFDTLCQRFGRQNWVERSGGALVATATLARIFPAARFILLTRSGPETALSMADYPAARLAARIWQRFLPLGVDLMAPDSHFGRGGLWRRLQSFSALIPVTRMLDRPADPVLLARFWSAMMVRGAQSLAKVPAARWQHLSYEALVADPRREIARVGAFLAGDAPEDWLAEAARLPSARQSRLERLPPESRAALIAACAPGQTALDRLLGQHGAA